jgi:hypothetical protein
MVPIPIQFLYKVWQVFTEYYRTFPVISWNHYQIIIGITHIIMVISNRDLSCNNLLIDSWQRNFKILFNYYYFNVPFKKLFFKSIIISFVKNEHNYEKVNDTKTIHSTNKTVLLKHCMKSYLMKLLSLSSKKSLEKLDFKASLLEEIILSTETQSLLKNTELLVIW